MPLGDEVRRISNPLGCVDFKCTVGFRVMMPDSGKSNKAYKLIKVMKTAENGPDHHAGCTPFPQSRIISNENYAKGVVTEILKAEILHTMLEQRP